MSYTINIAVYYNNTPVFFRATQISRDEYYVVCSNKSMNGFTVKKRFGKWKSDENTEGWKALLIGEQIDKLNMFGLKGPLSLS